MIKTLELNEQYMQFQQNKTNDHVRHNYINRILNTIDPQIKNQQPSDPIQEFILNYYNKDETQVRQNFYNKLFFNKQFQKTEKDVQKQQSLIIYDWDDTLFPTSYLTKNGKLTQEEETLYLLKDIDQTCSQLIQESINLGDVYIITNAGEGWVEFSAQKFLPTTYIKFNRVQIISARSLFENLYPNDQFVWKQQAFQSLKLKYSDSTFTNMITIGDSNYEILSAGLLQKYYKFFKRCFLDCVSKTIKLKESPSFDELLKQQKLLLKKLNQIHNTNKNLTIKLEKFLFFKKKIRVIKCYKIYLLIFQKFNG